MKSSMSVSLRRRTQNQPGGSGWIWAAPALRRPSEEEGRRLWVSQQGEEARAPRPPDPAAGRAARSKSTPRSQPALGCPRVEPLAGQPQAGNSLRRGHRCLPGALTRKRSFVWLEILTKPGQVPTSTHVNVFKHHFYNTRVKAVTAIPPERFQGFRAQLCTLAVGWTWHSKNVQASNRSLHF